MKSKSPIGYPGGKSKMAKLIVSQFPKDTVRVTSPFMGGGHVEILAADSGMRVDASDLFRPLVVFWRELLERPAELSEMVAQYMSEPMTKPRFENLRRLDLTLIDPLQQAAIFYILNKTSFASFGHVGNFSEARKNRVTGKALETLRKFRCPNLSVTCRDYKHAVYDCGEDTLIYADPPYPKISRKMYVSDGRGFDHALFARRIMCRPRWIVSYYDTPEIRALFRGHHMARVRHAYCCRNDNTGLRDGNELLIMSDYVYDNAGDRFPPELEWV